MDRKSGSKESDKNPSIQPAVISVALAVESDNAVRVSRPKLATQRQITERITLENQITRAEVLNRAEAMKGLAAIADAMTSRIMTAGVPRSGERGSVERPVKRAAHTQERCACANSTPPVVRVSGTTRTKPDQIVRLLAICPKAIRRPGTTRVQRSPHYDVGDDELQVFFPRSISAPAHISEHG
jgi:hypothetical protein